MIEGSNTAFPRHNGSTIRVTERRTDGESDRREGGGRAVYSLARKRLKKKHWQPTKPDKVK